MIKEERGGSSHEKCRYSGEQMAIVQREAERSTID